VSKNEKLIERLTAKPKDFTWEELKRVLGSLGYTEHTGGKTAGSRRRFVHETRPPILLHKPHPGNVLKSYQLAQVVAHLRNERLL
jgi:hypothetical protein